MNQIEALREVMNQKMDCSDCGSKTDFQLKDGFSHDEVVCDSCYQKLCNKLDSKKVA